MEIISPDTTRKEWTKERLWIEVENKGLYPPGKGTKVRGALNLIKDVNFAGKTVLDIGCGTGWLSKIMKARGAEVTGIDISDALLKAASGYIPVCKASAYDLPIADNSVDFVTSLMVLQILNDPAKAITEMRRVLKPNGKAFVGIVHPEAERWDEDTGLCYADDALSITEVRPWIFNLTDERRFTKHYIHRPMDFYRRNFEKLFDINNMHEPVSEEGSRGDRRYASHEYLFVELTKK